MLSFLFTRNEYKSSYDKSDRNFYRFGYGFIKKFDKVEINYEQQNIILYTNQKFSEIHSYSITFLIIILTIYILFFISLFYLFLLNKFKNKNDDIMNDSMNLNSINL